MLRQCRGLRLALLMEVAVRKERTRPWYRARHNCSPPLILVNRYLRVHAGFCKHVRLHDNACTCRLTIHCAAHGGDFFRTVSYILYAAQLHVPLIFEF